MIVEILEKVINQSDNPLNHSTLINFLLSENEKIIIELQTVNSSSHLELITKTHPDLYDSLMIQ